MDSKETKRIQKLNKLMDSGVTEDNFDVAVFDTVVELEEKVEKLEQKTAQIDELSEAVKERSEGEMKIIAKIATNLVKDIKGDAGPKGEKGDKGEDGKSIVGPQGPKGDKGQDGKDGLDGYTPIKGKDYFTDEDINLISLDVQSQIDIPKITEKTPEEIVEKVNQSEIKIKSSQVEGFKDLDQIVKNNNFGFRDGVSKTEVAELRRLIGTRSGGIIVSDIDGSPSVTDVTAIKFTNGSVTDNGDGTVSVTTGAGGGGDVSSNTSSSVDSELALFSGTGGKTIKRAATTGILKGTSGVLSAATAGTDYYAPGSTDVAVADGGTGASTAADALINLGLTATAAELNALDGITATVTELNYTDGVTSAIQTQLNAKADDSAVVHDTGDETIAGVKTFSSDPLIPDEAYGAGWNGSLEPATKNAIYDKIEAIPALTDGDKGDITVSSSGTVWTVDNDAITYAKIQDVSATARLLGRTTAGSGVIEEVVIDTDLSSVSASDDTIPSAKATKTALDLKAPLASPTFTGTVTIPNGAVLGTPTSVNLANATFPTLNQNTTGSAATLTTPRAIYGNNFDGSAALTQVIASTYGGTGNGFAKLSGPATSEKTFTLPNANATILTDNAAVTVAQGGTGLTSQGATDTVLQVNGIDTVTWAKVNVATQVTGSLPVANGGTGRATSTTAYGLLAAGTTATGAHQTLAAGATTEILVGGGASALPVWTTAQGSGAPVRATSPTLTTPVLGVATATSINKVAITAPATSATLTVADGKTLTASNTITLSGTDSVAMNVTNNKIRTLTFVIDGGGSAITTGIKGDLEIPFACTISAVTLLADQSGSIVVDIWKDTYANYPATDADSITASAVPTISSATKSQDTTLTGWTTSVSAGDILRFNVDSITTCTRVTLSLKVITT